MFCLFLHPHPPGIESANLFIPVALVNLAIVSKQIKMAKKEFPEIKEKNEGKFTAWVKKNMPGKSTCAAASKVMKNTKKYKPAVVKMANYANNFGCKRK